MPVFEMPLEKLRVYRGTNPRPRDFDSFWDESVREMEALDPEVALEPSAFTAAGAECFDLTYTGVGGARIYAKYLRPKGRAKLPAVVIFHGYSSSSGDWFDKLAWVSEGFAVAAMDCRGQGGRSEDRGAVRGNTLHGHIIRGLDEDSPARLLYRSIFLDAAQIVGILSGFPEVDATRIGATGGSQGGGLTLACAALAPAVRRAAPVYPFLCDYRRIWDMDLSRDAYAELRDYFRRFDPRHEREDDVFTRLGYVDCQFLAERIRADVLMGTGLMDQICPPSTQFAAYNRLRGPKDMVMYPDFGHENLPGMADRILAFMAGM